MSDGKRKPSFWETIPGIITAIGTLLAGVGTLITALYAAGIIGTAKPKTSSPKTAATQTGKTQQSVSTGVVSFQPAVKKTSPSPVGPKQGDIMIEPITGMKFVYVPEGCFMMGSNNGFDDERPVHEVCVDSFWMGKYEVTNRQFRRFRSAHDSGEYDGKSFNSDRQPVVGVTWEDARDYAAWLARQSGKKIRLPTEAEWEYAARGGTDSRGYIYSGGHHLEKVGWYSKNNGKKTHEVGQLAANELGLHDMSGNVFEWCADWYDSRYYAERVRDNPQGPATGPYRVLRGGSYFNRSLYCRSVIRFHDVPKVRYDYIGFRLVLPFQVAGS